MLRDLAGWARKVHATLKVQDQAQVFKATLQVPDALVAQAARAN